MRRSLLIIIFLFTTSLAWGVSVPPHSPSPAAHEELVSVDSIKFRDAQGTVVPPSISKSWRLISVSTGEKSNSNNLWFQDTDGSVYLLQGFTSQSKFFIHENVYKIPAK
jgi:hypothetical protein